MTYIGGINARKEYCEAKMDEAFENGDLLEYRYWAEEWNYYAELLELPMEDT